MSKKDNRSRYVEYGGKTDKYTWDQTEDEVTLSLKVSRALRGKDITVKFSPKKLQVGIKGKPLIIDGELFLNVVPDDCAWTIDDGNLDITLQKASNPVTWWKSVIVGDAEIDVEKIESTKYLDDSLLKKIKEKNDAEKLEKQRAEEEQKKKEREEFLAKMTDAEREEFLRKEGEERKAKELVEKRALEEEERAVAEAARKREEEYEERQRIRELQEKLQREAQEKHKQDST